MGQVYDILLQAKWPNGQIFFDHEIITIKNQTSFNFCLGKTIECNLLESSNDRGKLLSLYASEEDEKMVNRIRHQNINVWREETSARKWYE